MRTKYESEDGKVSGCGDEGKATVEAYESDPLSRFNFPWEYSHVAQLMVDSDGRLVGAVDYHHAALLGSRLAPLVRKLVENCTDEYGDDWRTDFSSAHPTKSIMRLETALNETLNG